MVTLALAGVLVGCAGVSVALASVAVTRHRAAAAADLAALSAALHAGQGTTAACAAARRTALEQATVLTSCRLEGRDAVVEVSARPAPALARFGMAVAQARAGPARLLSERRGGCCYRRAASPPAGAPGAGPAPVPWSSPPARGPPSTR